jgi:hypothetical protein
VSKHGARVLVWVHLKKAGCARRQEPRNAGKAGRMRDTCNLTVWGQAAPAVDRRATGEERDGRRSRGRTCIRVWACTGASAGVVTPFVREQSRDERVGWSRRCRFPRSREVGAVINVLLTKSQQVLRNWGCAGGLRLKEARMRSDQGKRPSRGRVAHPQIVRVSNRSM